MHTPSCFSFCDELNVDRAFEIENQEIFFSWRRNYRSILNNLKVPRALQLTKESDLLQGALMFKFAPLKLHTKSLYPEFDSFIHTSFWPSNSELGKGKISHMPRMPRISPLP